MTEVIIPVKTLDYAKQRLADVLSTEQRAGLVLAMLQDVLQTLATLPTARVWVLSNEPKVFKLARQFQVRCIKENQPQGYNNAVRLGFQNFPHDNVAVLPADIPLVTQAEITELIQPTSTNKAMVRLAPARDQLGTNGLFLSCSDIIKPNFGENSFNHYMSTLQQRKINNQQIFGDGIGLDIDTPTDLHDLINLTVSGATYEFLQSSNIVAKLATLKSNTLATGPLAPEFAKLTVLKRGAA